MSKLPLIAPFLLLLGCTKSPLGVSVKGTSVEYVAFAGQSNIVYATGLSAAFAGTASASGRLVIPIECAQSGTKIDQWQKGESLYENCLTQMKAHPPTAIVWWQGESDANTQADASAWSIRFTRMVGDLRHDLGYQIPVVYVILGNGNNGSEWETIQSSQQNLHLSKCYSQNILFADFYRIANDVHYLPGGYRVIGQALASQYMEHVP